MTTAEQPASSIVVLGSHLAKEQEKALAVLVENKSKISSLLRVNVNFKKSAPLIKTNFMAASFTPFTKYKLPRESHWYWNQSNAKASVLLDGESVTFRKISPRKKHNLTAPFYKIWIYHLHSQPNQYFLWCEKGVDFDKLDDHQLTVRSPSEGISTAIGTVFPQEISIASLSFLKCFIDDNSAKEFGWLD